MSRRIEFNNLERMDMIDLDYNELKEREKRYRNEMYDGDFIKMREDQIDLLACQVGPLSQVKQWIKDHPDASALEVMLRIERKLDEINAEILRHKDAIEQERTTIGENLAEVQGRIAVLEALQAGKITVIEE